MTSKGKIFKNLDDLQMTCEGIFRSEQEEASPPEESRAGRGKAWWGAGGGGDRKDSQHTSSLPPPPANALGGIEQTASYQVEI